ncbi:hypothetical protein JCM8547_009118 [Rhodosporidiobolus lusitaniae]
MQPSQGYYHPHPPQPPRPPGPYSPSNGPSSYPSVRPLPTPNSQARPPQSYSSASFHSLASPPASGPSGYGYGRAGGDGYGWSGSGQDSLRGNNGSGASQQGAYGQGGYRREASTGPSLTSPSSSSQQQQRHHSPLPPLPARQTSYSVSPPAPSAPPPSSGGALPRSPSSSRSSNSPTSRSFSPRSSQHPQPFRSPSSTLPANTICTATADLESLAVVSLGNLSSIEALKDVVMSKLRIADEDMPRHSFYLTTIGQGEGRPVSDDELWEAVLRSGKGEGPQVTVFVKEVVPASQAGLSGADFEGGMSAEKLRQIQHARERERARERTREQSGSSSRSPTMEQQQQHRRDRGASISSRSDVSSGQRAVGAGGRSVMGEVDEFGAPAGGTGSGLRSDRPQWVGGASSWSHGSRALSASEGASSSGGPLPHPRSTSGGQLSPPGSGFRGTMTGISQTTSPEDYFHASPPLSSVVQSPPLGGPSPSPFHPHLPTAPPALGGSSQVVMGPSGPTRFLPPQPQPPPHPEQYDLRQRGQTAPAIHVSAPGWSHAVQAPQHGYGSNLPSSRPVMSSVSRTLPPNDPRHNLPQYSSQPYKNLPLPSGSSPYHNLALQSLNSSVQHVAQPPSHRAGALALPQQPSQQRMGSKSADNLRGTFAMHPQPPVPPAPSIPNQYRSPTAPGGFSSSSRGPLPSADLPTSPGSSFVTPPPLALPTPASAFYSAPVQAQHQDAARAGPSGPPAGHSQSQPYIPHAPVKRPALEQQSHSQPAGLASSGMGLARPSTIHELTMGGFDVRPGETVQQGKVRRASENVAGYESEASAGGGAERKSRISSGGSPREENKPAGGTAARDAALSPTLSPSSSERPSPLFTRHESPSAPSTTTTTAHASPVPSAPPFQDDDGAYDGIPDADRGPLPASGTSTSISTGSSSARSSTNGPLTPAGDAHVPINAPPIVSGPQLDEFGDPIDEETSTWFPIGQGQPLFSPPASTAPPAAPAVDEFGDPLDEETSTWFAPPSAASQAPRTAGPKLDEFGDPIDEETSTWFPVGQPALVKPSPPAPIPIQPPSSATRTTAPSPSVYGSSASPMRRQHSAPGTATSPSPASSTRGPGSGGASAVPTHERRDSVPTAQDWQSTILNRFGAGGSGAGGEEGTLLPTGTLRPALPAQTQSQPVVEKPKLVDEFGDDLEEEGATFFPGHGPAGALTAPTTQVHPPSPHSPTFGRHHRPTLRLAIDAPTPPPASAGGTPNKPESGEAGDLPPLPVINANNGRRSAGPNDSGTGTLRRGYTGTPRLEDLVRVDGRGPAAPPSPFARRNSFAARAQDDKNWAFRPPVETVLENLDHFFPEHDLDKPVFDLPTPGPSTPSTNSSSSPIRDVAAVPAALALSRVRPGSNLSSVPGGGGSGFSTASSTGAALGYKKSIRVVALDRKRQLQKAGRNVASAASGLANNLLRRRSTKLFGARIEEVTSAQMKQINAIKETSVEDPENFSYKWIKGDLIGRGTYGHVYIALSVTTGETIAVKQVEMPRTYSDKEDQRTKGMISSLKAEIELLKDLDHPNIVLYLGMEQTPEFLSIFLEYVPGGSIGRIIRTHGKFEENVIKFFTLQILDGLGYLHKLGILHRDMKADNILIDQDGMCKISDFGTSKKSGDIYQNNENMSMQGSIFWMAPEVIHNNKQGYSAKADIWSLGCICIEMLAGSRPWEGEGFMGAMFKLGAERMRPPLPPDVQLSKHADEFVSACLQIEPEDRPKASEAKHHPFLIIDPGWSFTETSLYRIMTNEEDRRRIPTTPSAQPT